MAPQSPVIASLEESSTGQTGSQHVERGQCFGDSLNQLRRQVVQRCVGCIYGAAHVHHSVRYVVSVARARQIYKWAVAGLSLLLSVGIRVGT